MEIRTRDHYFYVVESFYMDDGWHWLMPLNEFRIKFVKDPDAPYRFESQVQLEHLLTDMKNVIDQHSWLDCNDIDICEYVFFIPDSFCPKFGVIWDAGRYGTVIVSPFPLPHIAKHILREHIPPDEDCLLGPVKLPFRKASDEE